MIALVFVVSAVFTVIPTLTQQRFDGMSLIGVILMIASATYLLVQDAKRSR